MEEKRIGKSSLPKLESLIRYHEDIIKKKDSHARIKDRNNSLEVEPVSKIHSRKDEVQRIHHRPNIKYYENRLLPPLKK